MSFWTFALSVHDLCDRSRCSQKPFLFVIFPFCKGDSRCRVVRPSLSKEFVQNPTATCSLGIFTRISRKEKRRYEIRQGCPLLFIQTGAENFDLSGTRTGDHFLEATQACANYVAPSYESLVNLEGRSPS